MARSVKCLPHKCEDLSLGPQNQCEEPSVVASTCNPSDGRRETEIRRFPSACWPASQPVVKIQVNKTFLRCLRNDT